MDLWTVQRQAMVDQDKIMDDLKIEWFKGGSDLRRVMMDAIQKAYDAGREMEQLKQIQEKCKHDITYNRTGGTCRLCGYNDLHCSSD